MPEYRISFKLHKNGITRDLVMDYGDFSMTGKLVNLTLFDVKPQACNQQGRRRSGGRLELHRHIRAAEAEQAAAAGMTAFNRVFMLKGIPVLRDLPPFSKCRRFAASPMSAISTFPPRTGAARSRCGPGKATFITPNHPEFFTDWMIDKEIIARVSPLAASWATHGVVNGLGRLAQKFWLANNLIAQIPGNSAAARAHSVAWALEGHGVLLHPEGGVGWHNNMSRRCCRAPSKWRSKRWRAGANRPAIPGLGRAGRVEARLHQGCREAAACRMRLCRAPAEDRGRGVRPVAAERVYRIYEALLARDEERLGLTAAHSLSFAERQAAVIAALSVQLARMLDVEPSSDRDELLRLARRKLRDKAALDREPPRR